MVFERKYWKKKRGVEREKDSRTTQMGMGMWNSLKVWQMRSSQQQMMNR
jgi:ABC-type tungstate transport system permease subunit